MFSLKEIWFYKLEILIIFLGSLLSFYFKSLYSLRIFDFVSFILLVFVFIKSKNRFDVDRRVSIFLYFFTVLITISTLVSVFHNAVELYIPRILGTYFAVIYSFFFFSYFRSNVKGLIKGIKYTLIFHSIFFYIQFIYFYFLRIDIDWLEPITGNSSRNIGGQFNLDTAIRASGLYSEPASYSLFILTFMSVYIYYMKRINLIDLLILVSVIFSMSASGLIYLVLFSLIYFVYYIKFSVLKKIFFVLASFLFILFMTKLNKLDVEFVLDKAINYENSASYQYRIGNTETVLNELSDSQIIFGIGYANLDIKENKGSTYSSLFIEQGILLGAIFLLGLLILFLYFKINIGVLIFVFILFMGTHAFAQIQFWIWILSLLIVSENLTKYDRENL